MGFIDNIRLKRKERETQQRQRNIVDSKSNDSALSAFPSLQGKIYSDKSGLRFVNLDDIISTCIDKEFLYEIVNDFLNHIKDANVSVDKSIEHFENEMSLLKQ